MERWRMAGGNWRWVFLVLLEAELVVYSGVLVIACSANESKALLSVKGNSISTSLQSWKQGTDCCDRWDGVTCDPHSRDVIGLNITADFVDVGAGRMHMSSDICLLDKLQVFSVMGTLLSFEYPFDKGRIPPCFWNMTTLHHIQLDSAGLQGSMTEEVCQLKNLTHIDTGIDSLTGYLPTCIWNLTKLEHLDVTGLRHMFSSFTSEICNLENLRHLGMYSNMLLGYVPPCLFDLTNLEHLDLSNTGSAELDVTPLVTTASVDTVAAPLQYLDLSNTGINGAFPDWIGNLSRLEALYYSGNTIIEPPPSTFGNSSISTTAPVGPGHLLCRLSRLKRLHLSSTSLNKIDFATDCDLLSLQELDLSHNNFSKFDFVAASNFSNLTSVDLSSNSISGELSIPRSIIFPNLEILDVSGNELTGPLSISSSHFPMLFSLDVSNNHLTGSLPAFLYSLGDGQLLRYLNVSGNQFEGRVSEVRWGMVFAVLDLSSNNFVGPLPSFALTTFKYLILSRNEFTGPIPLGIANSTYIGWLDLSFNRLSGTVPAFLGHLPQLELFDVSFNQLSGQIPKVIGNATVLAFLNLASNHFTGELPSSLGNCSRLQRLHVGSNALTGPIPDALGRLGSSLLSLSLRNNSFEGTIPPSLSQCTALVVLDLSNNKLQGSLLEATFQNLASSLRVFIVGSNHLTGEFPFWIFHGHNHSSLQVLDLSNNSFGGELPSDNDSYDNLDGFTNRWSNSSSQGEDQEDTTLYGEDVIITAKGGALELTYILSLRTSFDVSNNHFSGSIPYNLGFLLALRYLTLSGNRFSGTIPSSLSHLGQLESLDLSDNRLTGDIPWGLTEISTLAYFNVSNNLLTGRIPTGPQFSTFNRSSFDNNTSLCGPPLDSCPLAPETQPPSHVNDHDSFKDRISHWVSLPGFIAGFAGSFTALAITFAFSKRASSYLCCVPGRRFGVHYRYNEQYGAYTPKS